MAAPGRNEPCPCGSGKKFKHCHLVRAQPATGITPQDRAAATDALARYSERSEFVDAVEHAALVWMGKAPEGPFEGTPEDLADDIDEAFAEIEERPTSFENFWDWVYFDAPLGTGGTIAEAFLARRARSLHPRAEDYIRLMMSTHLRPYQVREARPGEGLTLRDLWTGDDIEVVERSASRQVVVWDTLVARVHQHHDGTRQLEGSSLLLPPDSARILKTLKTEYRRLQKTDANLTPEHFFKVLAPVFHQEWYDVVAMATLPTLQTTDGEELVASSMTFDVPQAGAAIVTVLDAPDFEAGDVGVAVWCESTPRGKVILGQVRCDLGTLTLETFSRERAERGRARLEELLGPLHVRHESHTDLREAARARTDGDVAAGLRATPRSTTRAEDGTRQLPFEDAIDPSTVPELAAFLDEQDRRWLDLEIPALGGQTPRAAAKDRRLRSELVSLLIDIENRQARMPGGSAARDITWMWKELGLKRP